MNALNETPRANRFHIGFFGKVNSGKSSLINSITGQDISIVSSVEGTTTDPVYKAMEMFPLGPCVLIDTAGINDNTALSEARYEKTKLAMEKTDLAVIVINTEEFSGADEKSINYEYISRLISTEIKIYGQFKEKKVPVLFVINKADVNKELANNLCSIISKKLNEEAVSVSAKDKESAVSVKKAFENLKPDEKEKSITGSLCSEKDVVMLVMPQDKQAPKGRLILPQVQTIRELLDKKCVVISVTDEEMEDALHCLKNPPKLIITDSQVFKKVYDKKPEESLLTSFSVLFAAMKGDIKYMAESVRKIDELSKESKVLILECCTHAPLSEDIGRVKIPSMLRKKIGEELRIDVMSGTDFPENIEEYDLIIQCGACMFNTRYVQNRIIKAKEKNIKMTNYGVTMAYLMGILNDVVLPEN